MSYTIIDIANQMAMGFINLPVVVVHWKSGWVISFGFVCSVAFDSNGVLVETIFLADELTYESTEILLTEIEIIIPLKGSSLAK